ncbi:hypothetical protein PIROE2DRAFT_11828 [Piromyces sp. E2]|nr:hypothetical protein PIROE2DRAFT_11828 [Piromyces sp. E2]|eukprot:OUM62008.1 hypothetical protein PIROE2DRAFT_11828 [Piromyces sp. E2]
MNFCEIKLFSETNKKFKIQYFENRLYIESNNIPEELIYHYNTTTVNPGCTEDRLFINVSTNCKTDTQCFSNKCIDNTCKRNVEANIKRCDFICKRPNVFTPNPHCYTNCGRMIGDDCTKDEDCSFKFCYHGSCFEDNYRPSEGDDIELVTNLERNL